MRSPRPLPLFLDMVRAQCGEDRAGLARVLEGLRRYQAAARPQARAHLPVIDAERAVSLRDYGVAGAHTPVVFVPSLINPPTVLDLDAERSLLRWLATQGLRPLLVDWGRPGPAERRLGLAGMVTRRLLPILRRLPEPPALAGYCLGGTLALAAAALTPVRRLALIAAPWSFAGYGADARDGIVRLWRETAPAARALGAMPMELLQPLFWGLDPAALARKYARLADLPEGSPELARFTALEDWSNDGAPLSLPVARALFEDFFRRDLPGRGRWRVGGQPIDPARLTMPVLNITSARDRIAPAATAAPVGERLDLDLGHVGMVVGSRGPRELWKPLAAFLRDA